MRQYIVRRLFLMIPGVLFLTVFVFSMVRIVPGDVIEVIVGMQGGGRGGYMSEDMKNKVRAQLGIDKPIYIQYFVWLGQIARGDLGVSLFNKIPVVETLKKRYSVTLELIIITMIVMVVWGFAIGIISATYQDTWVDYILRSVAVLGLSMPYFWIAILVVVFGSIVFNWSPPLGVNHFFDGPRLNLEQFVLPAAILGISQGSAVARMTRATILEIVRQDYVRTAKAKGLGDRIILTRHTLRNALIPVVSLIGITFAFSLGGTVILEQIWSLPGIGTLMLKAIQQRDYPVIQGIIIVLGLLVMVTNLIVDLSYGWLNPRIRFT